MSQPGQIKVGDFFESCAFHPCVCTSLERDGADIIGVSLVDGRLVLCDIRHCGVRRLSADEAMRWKLDGPADEMLPMEERWWAGGLD